MQTTLFMAMSANGLIARPDGNEDFLSDDHWQDLTTLVETYGNMIVGSATYKTVKSWQDPNINFDRFNQATKIVLSKDPNMIVDPGYIVATSPQEALDLVQKHEHSHALLTGGPSVNSAFLEKNLINECVINIDSVLVGEGKNMFAPIDTTTHLAFVSATKKEHGLVQCVLRLNILSSSISFCQHKPPNRFNPGFFQTFGSRIHSGSACKHIIAQQNRLRNECYGWMQSKHPIHFT